MSEELREMLRGVRDGMGAKPSTRFLPRPYMTGGKRR